MEAANWVSNNAGSIATAAQVIASIAAAGGDEDEFLADESGNVLPGMVVALDKNQGTMLQLAVKNIPIPEPAQGKLLGGPYDLPGLWPAPGVKLSGATSALKPAPEIGIDVNKFLTLSRIPNVAGTGKDAMDIGEAIATYMFANADQKIQDNKYNTLPFSVSLPDGNLVSGGHVYYEIPLGNPGSHNAWHSHVRLYTVMAPSARKEWKEEQKSLAARLKDDPPPPGQNYTTTTISAQWSGARAIAQPMSDAISAMQTASNGNIHYINPPVVDGTRYIYQFWTLTNIGPADVKAAFSSAIGSVLPPITDTQALPRMPILNIENIQTYIAG